MRIIKNSVFVLLAAVSLSACSYFDTKEGSKPAVSERIDLTKPDLGASAPGTTPSVQVLDVSKPMEGEKLSGMSNSSVQIFSLDDTAPSPVPPPAVEVSGVMTAPSGNIAAADESVQVFPIDQAQAVMPWTAERPTALYPSANAHVVYFAHASSAMNQEGRQKVSEIARSSGSSSLSVEGHASAKSALADTVARKIDNLKISMDRALNVSRALIQNGVPAERIETKAYGETRPPQNVSGMDLESASRRVEIHGASTP